MTRKTRRIAAAAALFVVLLALLYFARLVGGPPPVGAKAALRRAERNALRPRGEIVEMIENEDDDLVIAVTHRDGEIYTYCLQRAQKVVRNGRHRLMWRFFDACFTYDDSVGSSGCVTFPLSSYSLDGRGNTVHERSVHYLLKQDDARAVRAELEVRAFPPGEGERRWKLKAERTNPYYFDFETTRSLIGAQKATWDLYSVLGVLGGWSSPFPPDGTTAEAEAFFYDENDELIGTVSFVLHPEQGGEENGA